MPTFERCRWCLLEGIEAPSVAIVPEGGACSAHQLANAVAVTLTEVRPAPATQPDLFGSDRTHKARKAHGGMFTCGPFGRMMCGACGAAVTTAFASVTGGYLCEACCK